MIGYNYNNSIDIYLTSEEIEGIKTEEIVGDLWSRTLPKKRIFTLVLGDSDDVYFGNGHIYVQMGKKSYGILERDGYVNTNDFFLWDRSKIGCEAAISALEFLIKNTIT